MSSNPYRNPNSLYPEVDLSNPEATSRLISNPTSASSSSLYPSLEVKELAENLFPDENDAVFQNPSSQPFEEVLVRVAGVIVHLIDKQHSVELASGVLTIVRLRQGENVVAVLARIGDEIQWPLAKDEAAVKLDESHYFFSLRRARIWGQEGLLKELDAVLEKYSCFSVQKVKGTVGWEVLDGSVARETSPEDLGSKKKKKLMEERSGAYWTTLAPNVEDYSGCVARMIAAGSGQLIKGILWSGNVTVDGLNWGE
ncbi:Protein early-responsive to dehydration 7, chloroplastic [Vitis vinifera]|uniref:Protein early-responsive to dehydration 7, chloroplastic n=1 Tax=Vitis vinifera TaxID=29760 RepID=A0A438DSX5_VITVI|nr:Protein early-responsive to dehydration 7, chloroplastic [Vitis vinifera]